MALQSPMTNLCIAQPHMTQTLTQKYTVFTTKWLSILAVMISLLIHLFLLSMLALLPKNEPKHTSLHVVELLDVPPVQTILPEMASDIQDASNVISGLQIKTPQSDQLPSSTHPHVEPQETLTPQSVWQSDVDSERKRQLILQSQPSEASKQTLLADRVADWTKQATAFDASNTTDNPVSDMLEKRATGTSTLLFNPALLNLNQEDKSQPSSPPQFDFIPSRAQLAILAFLDSCSSATQVDLYPQMPSSISLTAETFEKELNYLVGKRFLTREKISPEQPLNLQILIVNVPFELSAKNRRNPVYRYKSLVNKKLIMTYLQARLDQERERLRTSPADSSRITQGIRDLKDKIQILL